MDTLTLILLQVSIFIYSFSSVFSKYASGETFLSFRYLLFTGMIIFCLGIYALLWQQILKRSKLSSAYAFKGLTLLWTIAFGYFIFSETVSLKDMAGALIVLIGIVIVTVGGGKNE